ncbi:MAG: hypothetical protein AB9M53_00845 [Leptothrix sp. (in: b-proteobacteria)]
MSTNERANRIWRYIGANPRATVYELRDNLQITYSAGRFWVKRMEACGLLSVDAEKKHGHIAYRVVPGARLESMEDLQSGPTKDALSKAKMKRVLVTAGRVSSVFDLGTIYANQGGA